MTELIYSGKKFNQREKDSYVNLGQLCGTHGKKLNDWQRLASSKEYLKALAETLVESDAGYPASDSLVVSEINNIVT